MTDSGFNSYGPELNISPNYWKDISFPGTEQRLRASLDHLYGSNEDDWSLLLADVSRRLACCDFIGKLAGLELPTPLMEEAQASLEPVLLVSK
jgi:hypothetical protein